MERIVLAYSGGLDTSVAIPWLAGKYGAEIVAVTMDLGQGKELEAVRDRALAAGAVRAHVLDVREEFARDYVLRALKADAMYEDRYPMGTALGRPLIARKLVEIAAIEQAGAIAHGGTGKGARSGAPRRRPCARIEPGHHGPRAGARMGHDASRGDRIREDARHSRAGDRRQPVQRRCQPVGALDRVRRPRGSVDGAAGGDLHADEVGGGVSRRSRLRGDDLRARRADRHQRRRHAARRAHREPRHHCRRPRRRPRHQVARIYEAPAAVVLHTAHKELQRMVTTRTPSAFRGS